MTQTTQKNEMAPGEMESASPSNVPGSLHGRSRRKKIIRWGAAGLAILLLAFCIPYYLHSLSYESTDDAFIDGTIVPISPRVTGYVSSVQVKDNQYVKAGDLLVELDPADFEARLDAAKAAFESAKASSRSRSIAVELTTITVTAELDEARDNVEAVKASVQKAAAGIVVARAALDQARAESDSANARHQLDDADLKRYREMAATQTVSEQDLDRAITAEHISAAALAAAEKNVDTHKAMIFEAESVLKAAEANLRQADARLVAARSAPQKIKQSRSLADVSTADMDKAMAEVVHARLNLSYTKVLAPSDGFVTKKAVEPGQFVQAGQSLLAIVPPEVWVTANFKETQLARMRFGQPVDIRVDAYPARTFHGHVDSIQNGTGARFSLLPPENATGNYVKVVQRVPVKIVLDRLDETGGMVLAPGMSVVPDVNITIVTDAAGTLKDSLSRNAPVSAKNVAGTP